MLKKVTALFLAVIITIATSLSLLMPISAANVESSPIVSSQEFPDAYIITEIFTQKDVQNVIYQEDEIEISLSHKNEKTAANCTTTVIINDPAMLRALESGEIEIAAICESTIFVEETYRIVESENGKTKIEILDSRLLSKKEVDEVGADEFTDLEDVYVPILAEPHASSTAKQSKGKLTIQCIMSTQSYAGYAKAYNLWGSASWSGYGLTDSESPSGYDDYLCYTWGGSYDYYQPSSSAVLNSGGSWTVTAADARPNAGYCWSVLERPTYADTMYVSNINTNITIRKATLTGNGNTTSVVFKYIHTYSSLAGSISFTAGSMPSFGLTGSSGHWSIMCTFTSMPY